MQFFCFIRFLFEAQEYVAFALAKKYYFHATFRAHEKKRERKTNNNKKKTEAHNLLSKVSFFKEK